MVADVARGYNVNVMHPLAIAQEKWRPLRRSEYDRLVADGVFEGEKIELLQGVLVRMSPQKAPHASTVQKLTQFFMVALSGRAKVFCQAPIALSDDSEPEPDVMVVPLANYDQALPDRALLLVEVAESSLKEDRQQKMVLYANAGIPEYWILNLEELVLEVYRDPAQDGYRRVTRHLRNEKIAPFHFPDVSVELDVVLPADRT